MTKPGGEQSVEGHEHTSQFRLLASQINWRARARSDLKIKSQVTMTIINAKGEAKEEPENMNIDSFFTFYCPVSECERGVSVDCKRALMGKTVTGSTVLSGYLEGCVEVIDLLRKSPDVLEKQYDIDPSTRFDTAMVVWYCHGTFNADTAKSWLSQIRLSRVKKPPIIGLIATNPVLDRLKSICLFKKTVFDLEYFYSVPSRSYSVSSTVLTPEYMFSSYIPFQYRRGPDGPQQQGVFIFDAERPFRPKVRFALAVAQKFFSGASRVEFHPMMTPIDALEFQQELDAEVAFSRVKNHTVRYQEFAVTRLEYNTYTV